MQRRLMVTRRNACGQVRHCASCAAAGSSLEDSLDRFVFHRGSSVFDRGPTLRKKVRSTSSVCGSASKARRKACGHVQNSGSRYAVGSSLDGYLGRSPPVRRFIEERHRKKFVLDQVRRLVSAIDRHIGANNHTRGYSDVISMFVGPGVSLLWTYQKDGETIIRVDIPVRL
ncbi:uncharacterized protein LOC131438477 [Malaya genurostris]|uniref:uncharacterized protein LOC131438104 n=1 Tax=Malaya genurostris TaxID=325434 RepID=UPI0026F3D6D0|nr:uncharacterized protein LOC131438104 [Malaya genurostris]XP_058464520.1 uncharacterized protein LOC131438477 [Malaya genurostris]